MKPLIALLIMLLLAVTASAQHTYIKSEDLFTNPTNKMGQLSADGKFFSYVSHKDSKQFLQFANVKTFQSATVFQVPEQSQIVSYTWLKHNTLHLVLQERSKSNEYIVNITTEDVMLGRSPEVSYFKLPQGYLVSALLENPEQVIFAKTKIYDNKLRHTLYKINIEDLKSGRFTLSSLLDKGADNLFRYFYDEGYKRIIGVFFDAEVEQVHLSYQEPASNKWQRIITFKDEDYKVIPVGFLSPTQVAVLTNKETNTIVLQSFDIESQSLGKILFQHDLYDLTNAIISPSGEVLAVEYYQSGLPQKEWIVSDGNMLSARLSKTFENGIPIVIDSSDERGRALIFVAGSDNPGEYYLYEQAEDKIIKLVSMYPQLDDFSFAKTESFKVAINETTKVEAFITKPTGLDLKSLIVMPHGGPIGVRDDSFFRSDIQFLVNRGFTVLRINFRGSSGYGKDFLERGIGEFGQLIEQDISKVVEKLTSTQPYKNICAVGASYGAYSSMMLAIKHPDIYQCVVASYGIYDLPLLFNYSNYRSGEDFQESVAQVVGEYSADKKDQSPVYLAEQINVPVLLIAGKQDRVAGFEQSNRMRYVLNKLDKDVEHIFYKRSGHGHSNWYLEQHESAYIVDYLYRQLDIQHPGVNDIDDYSADALAYDNLVLADEFDRSKHIDEDRARAFYYLQKATQYNSPRATFNEAAHFHRGDQVEFDMQKAMSLYEKSLQLGYDDAHRRLGQLYLEGIYIDKDDEKALFYLTAAVETEDTYSNQLILARLFCVAKDPIKDVPKCIEKTVQAAPNKGKGKATSTYTSHLARIVINGDYTSSERALVSDFVIEQLDIVSPSFDVDVEDEGLFTFVPHERFGRSGEFDLAKVQTMSLYSDEKSVNGLRFGVRFKIDTPGFSTLKDETFVIAKLEAYSADNRLLTINIEGNKRTSLYETSQVYKLVDYVRSESYVLSLYDVYGKQVYKGVFD